MESLSCLYPQNSEAAITESVLVSKEGSGVLEEPPPPTSVPNTGSGGEGGGKEEPAEVHAAVCSIFCVCLC